MSAFPVQFVELVALFYMAIANVVVRSIGDSTIHTANA